MIVNRASLEQADIGFQTRFNLAIERLRDKLWWQKLALKIPSTHREEVYPWVTSLPQMKEWVSDAQFAHLTAYKFTLENKFWQAGLEVKREDMEDDRLGIIAPAIGMLAENAMRHPDKLIFQLLSKGFDATYGLAYDGQYFFDTDHQDGAGATQSNKGTHTLTSDAFDAAVVDMSKLQDEAGEPLDIRPTDIFVPPSLFATARAMFLLPFQTGGATNPHYLQVKVNVVNRLEQFSSTAWFLMDMDKPLLPFIFQEREALQFAAQIRPEDENNFMRRLYRWSAWARYNVGYAMWQTAWGSTGTDNS